MGFPEFPAPWLLFAACQSQKEIKERNLDAKAKDSNSVSSDSSGRNSSGEVLVHNKIMSETDPLSFKQAVDKADDLLEKRKLEIGSPGLAVCVSVDGKCVYARGFGYADVENKVAMRANSVNRIASISKAMTASIVAKLSEEGKIDLDRSVYHYVPKFPEKRFLGEKVDLTVRQLLSHTAGIRHYWTDNDPIKDMQPKFKRILSLFDTSLANLFYSNLKERDFKLKSAETLDNAEAENTTKAGNQAMLAEYYSIKKYATTHDTFKMFAEDPLMSKPGTKFLYSTLGYSLLAAVVESATKNSFERVMKDAFRQWGLKETYFDQHDPIIWNRARPYEKKKNGMLVNAPYVDVSYKWAGGGFLSTAIDVNKFGNLLLYSRQHCDRDPGLPGFLKQSTMEKFWTPIPQKTSGTSLYGLGFELWPAMPSYGMCPNHGQGMGHTGGAVGASSVMYILPRSLSLTNQDKGENVSKGESLSDQREVARLDKGAHSPSVSHESSSSRGALSLPQGVVVAVIVNLVGVSVSEVAGEVARVFERVIFD